MLTRIKRATKILLNLEKEKPRNVGQLFVNQGVNFDIQTIFVSIPKTGTTTVRRQIAPKGDYFFPNSHLNIIQIREIIYVYLLATRLKKYKEFPSMNIPSDESLREEAKHIFDTFFKFSAVRNPWARAVSIYFRKEAVQVRELITFEEFCEQHFYASDTCFIPSLHKNQIDWLTSETGDLLMDYVYKVEDYSKAILEIKEITNGRVLLQDIIHNKNPESKSRDYREMYNDATRKIIANRFEKDIDTFKYTF